jgi:hypothetical protein
MCGVLLGVAPLILNCQEFSDRYRPLVRALVLTDAQITLLQQMPGDVLRTGILDGAQQSKLAEIARVLQRFETSAGAVEMGLMDARDWPTGWTCPPSSRIGLYAREFDLTADQVRRLEQLQNEVRQRAADQIMEIGNLLWKLTQAGTPPAPAVITEESSRLQKQRDEGRPPRDQALVVLNEAQKAKLAALLAELELAREALDLHLVRLPSTPEVFCH